MICFKIMLLSKTNKTISRAVCVVLICGLLLSGAGVSSYAVTNTTNKFTLAPHLATQSQGDTLLRNEWIVAEIGRLIYPILKLAQEGKLQNPIAILIPHIKKNTDMTEIRGFDVDGIKEVREQQTIIGFSLPVTRNGTQTYRLVYNLRGGETAIQTKDGKNIYVKVESAEPSEKAVRIAVGLASFGHGTNEDTEFLSRAQALIFVTARAKMTITQNAKLAQYHTDIEMFNAKLNQAISTLSALHGKALDSIRGGTLTGSEVLSWLQQTEEAYNLFTECKQCLDSLKDKLQPSLSEQENTVLIQWESRMNAVYSMLADRLYLMTGKISEERFTLDDIFAHFFEHLSLTSGGAFKQYFELKISDTPIYIKGNRISAISLLCNLADDCFRYAIKFRKDDAKVIINAKIEGGKVVITISDNGNGMSPEELVNIWKPFHTTGGTGIGLTESRLIVKDHGGTIDVKSELGKGTTFTLRLPVVNESGSGQAIRFPIADQPPSADAQPSSDSQKIAGVRTTDAEPPPGTPRTARFFATPEDTRFDSAGRSLPPGKNEAIPAEGGSESASAKALPSSTEKTLTALETSGGHQTKAGRILGISQSAVSRRIQAIRRAATERGDTAILERLNKALPHLPSSTKDAQPPSAPDTQGVNSPDQRLLSSQTFPEENDREKATKVAKEFVFEIECKLKSVSKSLPEKIGISCYEMANNIMNHGEGGTIEVYIITETDGTIKIEVIGVDHGDGIDNPNELLQNSIRAHQRFIRVINKEATLKATINTMLNAGDLPERGFGLRNIVIWPDTVVVESKGSGWEKAGKKESDLMLKRTGISEIKVGTKISLGWRLKDNSISEKTGDVSKATTTPVAISPESERIHATNFQDTIQSEPGKGLPAEAETLADYLEDIGHDIGNLFIRIRDMASAIALEADNGTNEPAHSIHDQAQAVLSSIMGAINYRHRSAQYLAEARDAATILTPLLSEDAVTRFAEEFIRHHPKRQFEDVADDCRVARLILADCFGLKLDNTYGLGRLFDIAVVGHSSAKSIREFANVVTDRNIASDVIIPISYEPILFRVLYNLVGNAQKAMIGKVPTDRRRISISALCESGSVRISVTDTGVGLTPEQVICFNTGKAVIRADGTSIGRGLDICRINVAKLNGTISVESELGKGTTFTLRLPAVSDENSGQAIRLPISAQPVSQDIIPEVALNENNVPFDIMDSLLKNIQPTEENEFGDKTWKNIAPFQNPEAPSDEGWLSIYIGGAKSRMEHTYTIAEGRYNAVEVKRGIVFKDYDKEGQTRFRLFLTAIKNALANFEETRRLAQKKEEAERRDVAEVIPAYTRWTQQQIAERQQRMDVLQRANEAIEGVPRNAVPLQLFFDALTHVYRILGKEEHKTITSFTDISRSRYSNKILLENNLLRDEQGSEVTFVVREPQKTYIDMDGYQQMGGNSIEFLMWSTLHFVNDSHRPDRIRVRVDPRYFDTNYIQRTETYIKLYEALVANGIPIEFPEDFVKLYLGEYNIKYLKDQSKYPLFASSSVRGSASGETAHIGKATATPVITSPESERIHATNLQDTIQSEPGKGLPAEAEGGSASAKAGTTFTLRLPVVNESNSGLPSAPEEKLDVSDKTIEQIFSEIERGIPDIESWSQLRVPFDPENDLDFIPQQMDLVRNGKPLEFSPGLLYHGRDKLDDAVLNNNILGKISLSRVAHQWAVVNFNDKSQSPAIFVISTVVFNKFIDEGKAISGMDGGRKMGFLDPYPEITAPFSLDNVEEIWIDMDTYERYKSIIQNPTTELEKILKPKIEHLFIAGKFKVIPYLRHTMLNSDTWFKSAFTNVGRYMIGRGLFAKIPLLKEKEETSPESISDFDIKQPKSLLENHPFLQSLPILRFSHFR